MGGELHNDPVMLDSKVANSVPVAETVTVVTGSKGNPKSNDIPVAKILKEETITLEEENAKPVSIMSLFRYADALDIFLLISGAILGMANGAVMPLFSIILGDLFDDFNILPEGKTNRDVAAGYAKIYCYLAIAAFVASFGQMGFFTIAAERQAIRIRKAYLAAVLTQEIAWFDERRSGELSAKVAENTVIIKESMGDKLGGLFQFLAMAIAGFGVGFAFSWKLTLVIFALAPFLALGGYIMIR